MTVHYKVPADTLLDLINNSTMLQMLECGGVANWEGYEEVKEEFVALEEDSLAEIFGLTEEEN